MTSPKAGAPDLPTPKPGSPDAPSSQDVTKFHSNSDVDSSTQAQHHTLGIQHNQANPGDHNHNGKSSKKIGKGLDPSFPSLASATYSQAQVQAIIDALRDLGFGT